MWAIASGYIFCRNQSVHLRWMGHSRILAGLEKGSTEWQVEKAKVGINADSVTFSSKEYVVQLHEAPQDQSLNPRCPSVQKQLTSPLTQQQTQPMSKTQYIHQTCVWHKVYMTWWQGASPGLAWQEPLSHKKHSRLTQNFFFSSSPLQWYQNNNYLCNYNFNIWFVNATFTVEIIHLCSSVWIFPSWHFQQSACFWSVLSIPFLPARKRQYFPSLFFQ